MHVMIEWATTRVRRYYRGEREEEEAVQREIEQIAQLGREHPLSDEDKARLRAKVNERIRRREERTA